MAQENALTMIHSRILGTLRLLVTHKFQDDDILEDIRYLTEQLESVSVNIRYDPFERVPEKAKSSCSAKCIFQIFSSYDEYLSEIKSGALEWSPVHKCQQFWRENASRFNEANYELLKYVTNLSIFLFLFCSFFVPFFVFFPFFVFCSFFA
jgi:V-type H+-transporting ATPase subunit H